MKRIQIIYNPDSGRRLLQKNMPLLKELLLKEASCVVDMAETKRPFHGQDLAYEACEAGYDLIISAGGDGTLNEVVNGMMKAREAKIGLSQLAIYPAGTVNDFASFYRIPKQLESFSKLVHYGRPQQIDVGKAGNRYFLNVAAAGLLTSVAHKVSSDAKTFFGRFAYYFEGIKELPKQFFQPISIEFRTGTSLEKQEILFFILANSPQIGGFRNLASEAKTDDGLFDLILVENTNVKDIASLLILLLQGNHINHPSIRYMQLKEFSIHAAQDMKVDVDVDGEEGGVLPMGFKVVAGAITLLIPD